MYSWMYGQTFAGTISGIAVYHGTLKVTSLGITLRSVQFIDFEMHPKNVFDFLVPSRYDARAECRLDSLTINGYKLSFQEMQEMGEDFCLLHFRGKSNVNDPFCLAGAYVVVTEDQTQIIVTYQPRQNAQLAQRSAIKIAHNLLFSEIEQ